MFGRVLLNVNTSGLQFLLTLLSFGVGTGIFLLWTVVKIVYQGIDLENLVL